MREAISIHALREEGDAKLAEGHPPELAFLSTPSARRATRYSIQFTPFLKFLSTPSARRATQECRLTNLHTQISIHALREEGDVSATSGEQTRSISIHALREEGDEDGGGVGSHSLISIHALREEGDMSISGLTAMTAAFLSTPSARRATKEAAHDPTP